MFDIRLIEQMWNIPIGNFYHADRYDTDTEYVIHLWNDDGQSFDIRIEKAKCYICNEIYDEYFSEHLLMKHHIHAG